MHECRYDFVRTNIGQAAPTSMELRPLPFTVKGGMQKNAAPLQENAAKKARDGDKTMKKQAGKAKEETTCTGIQKRNLRSKTS